MFSCKYVYWSFDIACQQERERTYKLSLADLDRQYIFGLEVSFFEIP